MTTRRRASKRRQGFTLIEVMVSLGIMTIGAMAMIALQAHTIRANAHARQLTTAMQIAQRWVERLKQDSFTWRTPGVFNSATEPNDTIVLANTTFLKQVAGAPNIFQTINNTTNTVSNAFDYQGNDIANDGSALPPIFYCASFRPVWVFYGRALRVDVRVWWAIARNSTTSTGETTIGTADITNDFSRCADDNIKLNPGSTVFDKYHVAYLSTVIRMMSPPI